MSTKQKVIFYGVVMSFAFLLFSCEDKSPPPAGKTTRKVISKTISNPLNKSELSLHEKVNEGLTTQNLKPDTVVTQEPVLAQKKDEIENEHYQAQGKINPFTPLIQEKKEASLPVENDRPKRILTPLEKLDLSQIRLVAIILMKKRQLAMVEEPNGKGYEVGIGTYIGKNQGRVSEIRESSIIVKELVKDYKGRVKEKSQEIKLHKNDSEE